MSSKDKDTNLDFNTLTLPPMGTDISNTEVLDVTQTEDSEDNKQLTYGVNKSPPWHIAIPYAFQILMSMLSGPLSVVYLINITLFPNGDNLVFAEMLSTAIFMCGICTLMQTTIGVRLPVFQGSSHSFIPPLVAVVASKSWPQSDSSPTVDPLDIMNSTTNSTSNQINEQYVKIQLVSGALIAASAIQLLIGVTGVMGFLMTYIGPLTIAPCVTLIGLSLAEVVAVSVAYQWGIGILTIGLVVFFGLYIGRFSIPFPGYSRGKGCTADRYPIFKLYQQLLAILIVWLLCYILTVTNVFSPDSTVPSYKARTDVKLDALHRAAWVFFPYPGRWGWPRFHAGLFAGMISATISSIIESVGDYYSTAAVCRLPPPPKHAVNRGIAMEGFGSILSGLVGASHATTTYSGVIGYIGLTGVGSRTVFQLAAVIAIIAGIFGKFGAVLALVPDPILGGMNTVGLGMVATVGLSNLRHIDLKSSRNHMVLGLALMLGFMLPRFVRDNPGAINTGNDAIDQVFVVFLSTPMFIGGVVGFTLDNLVPGSAKERGLLNFQTDSDSNVSDKKHDTYSIPLIGRCINKFSIFSYIPCLPSYKERQCCPKCHRKHKTSPADDRKTNGQPMVATLS